MFEPMTDHEKITKKLNEVGATIEQQFDNSTQFFSATAKLDFWIVAGKPLLVVYNGQGECGLYPFLGKDGDPIEKDLLFLDLLVKKPLAEDEIVFDGLLSKAEIRQLQESVRRNGEIDEAEAEKLVRWANQARTDKELLDLLLEEFTTVVSWKGDEPQFGIPFAESGFETSMLEESDYVANVQ